MGEGEKLNSIFGSVSAGFLLKGGKSQPARLPLAASCAHFWGGLLAGGLNLPQPLGISRALPSPAVSREPS